jgi:predicted metal-dependent hydrolase
MKELSLPFPELRIRKMRSRWGSCSRRAEITLNLELIRMPLDCIDYVITHELCHLVEFNHSARFYELQSRFFPDWKERRRQLEELGRR